MYNILFLGRDSTMAKASDPAPEGQAFDSYAFMLDVSIHILSVYQQHYILTVYSICNSNI